MCDWVVLVVVVVAVLIVVVCLWLLLGVVGRVTVGSSCRKEQ